MSERRKGKISVHQYQFHVRTLLGNRKLTTAERVLMRKARLDHIAPSAFATSLLVASGAETVPVEGATEPTRLDVIHAERAADAKRLKTQGARLRKAASLLDVAAAYHDDGAYQTALDRIDAAAGLVMKTAAYMNAGKWRVRGKA